MKQRQNRRTPFKMGPLFAVILFSLVAVSSAHAATLTVLVDTPTAFRATFTGVDTDASTLSGGDFFGCTIVPCQFKYWSVLMNLRGDSVTSGNANGFYEIQLIHSGSLLPDPAAPLVNTSLTFTGLAPGTIQTDDKSSSQPHAKGTEVLSTTANITFDDLANTVSYAGTIAGDSDLDNDGEADAGKPGANDDLVHVLDDIKNSGGITGQQQGQIISDSRPKPGQKKKQ